MGELAIIPGKRVGWVDGQDLLVQSQRAGGSTAWQRPLSRVSGAPVPSASAHVDQYLACSFESEVETEIRTFSPCLYFGNAIIREGLETKTGVIDRQPIVRTGKRLRCRNVAEIDPEPRRVRDVEDGISRGDVRVLNSEVKQQSVRDNQILVLVGCGQEGGRPVRRPERTGKLRLSEVQ